MGLEIASPALHEMNPFDEARCLIDEWQRECPDAERLVLIVENPDNILVYNTGAVAKPSEITGICFMAAQVVADDE